MIIKSNLEVNKRCIHNQPNQYADQFFRREKKDNCNFSWINKQINKQQKYVQAVYLLRSVCVRLFYPHALIKLRVFCNHSLPIFRCIARVPLCIDVTLECFFKFSAMTNHVFCKKKNGTDSNNYHPLWSPWEQQICR